jgi:hypothetical protein
VVKHRKPARKPVPAAPAPAPPSLRRRSTWLWCAAILALAFALRLDTILAGGLHRRVIRTFETQAVAESLVRSGSFADPFRTPTGATAHLAPAFPLFLAALMRTTPDDAAYELAKEALSALAASLHYALLPIVALALGMDRRTGILAAAISIGLFALLPANVKPLETQGSWENTWAALGIVMLSILAGFTLRRPAFPAAAAWGVGWGLFLLLIPTMAPVFPAWITLGLWRSWRENRARYLRFAAVAPACLLLTLAPWTLRNLRVLGAPVWGRDNFGLELSVSNNDCAEASFVAMLRSGCHARTHPNVNAAEAHRLREIGEVRYNAQRLHQALAWIRAHPGRFAGLTAERFRHFWFPVLGPGPASWPLWAVTLLGFAGLAFAWRTDRFAALLLAAPLLLYPAVYYLVQHVVRYRYPVLWVSAFLTSHALVTLWCRFHRGATAPRARRS